MILSEAYLSLVVLHKNSEEIARNTPLPLMTPRGALTLVPFNAKQVKISTLHPLCGSSIGIQRPRCLDSYPNLN